MDLALYRARIGGFCDGHGHLQRKGRDPFRKRRLSTMGEWLVCMVVGVTWISVACLCLQVNNSVSGFHVPNRRELCKVGGSYRVSGAEKLPLWHCHENENFLERGMDTLSGARKFSRRLGLNRNTGVLPTQLWWGDSALPAVSAEERMTEGLMAEALKSNQGGTISLRSELQRDICDFCGVVGLFNKTKWRDSGVKTRLVLEMDRLSQKEDDFREFEFGGKIVLWSALEREGWDAMDVCIRTLSCMGEIKLWTDLIRDEGSVEERRWGLLTVRNGWVLDTKTSAKLKKMNSKYEKVKLCVSGDIHPNPGPVTPVTPVTPGKELGEKEIANDPSVQNDTTHLPTTAAAVSDTVISFQLDTDTPTPELLTSAQSSLPHEVKPGSSADSPFMEASSQLLTSGKPDDVSTTTQHVVIEGAVKQFSGTVGTSESQKVNPVGVLGAEYLKELEEFLQSHTETTSLGKGPTVGLESLDDRRALGETREGENSPMPAATIPPSQGSGGRVTPSGVKRPQDDTKGTLQHLHQGGVAPAPVEPATMQPQKMTEGPHAKPSTRSAPVVGAAASNQPQLQVQRPSPSPVVGEGGVPGHQAKVDCTYGPPEGDSITSSRDVVSKAPVVSSGVGGIPIPGKGEGNPDLNNCSFQSQDSALKWGGGTPQAQIRC